MNRIGARAHDYGRAAPDALLGRIAADGWQTVQLAMTKCLAGVDSWDAVTPAVVADARRALAAHGLTVAVLGAYVELGLASAYYVEVLGIHIYSSHIFNIKSQYQQLRFLYNS